jgi:TolB-like protein/Tfp pilus assembly protein PilF
MTTAADSGALPRGTTVSRYRILERLGAGGMGVVYKAEDLRLGRLVALKFLAESVSGDRGALDRLEREARAASVLNHPHICTIHDIDQHGSHKFISMELLEGESLDERKRGGAMPVAAVLRVASQVADALAAAHAVRIVHRDIKPANIFITTRGDVKVLDLGIAKIMGEAVAAGLAETDVETFLTAPGAAVGTIAYMSPEQALGRDVDGRSDIFSLGVVLYEMATGQRPFRGETAAGLFDELLHKTPPPVSQLNAAIPSGLARVIAKCLEKDRARRYATAAELKTDVDAVSVDTDRPASVGAGEMTVAAGAGRRLRSLAVLPFDDLSAAKDQGHLCRGLADELMTSLAKIRELRLAARTSAFALGTRGDPVDVARQLDVDAIVRGVVQKSGGRLRITAQLLDGRDGTQVWSGRFDREDRDIFAVQDAVTAAIIEHLQLALVPEEREGVFRRRTNDLEAHRLYLEGLECLWVRSGAADAITRFHGAIEKDPRYAQAYWGLSDAYLQLAFWSTVPPTEACRQVKHHARNALALDPSLGDPHGALSYVHLVHDWDVVAAKREIQEALHLSPNSSMVRAYHSWFLLHMGRIDEGVAEALRAQALDPASSFIAFAAGLAFILRADFPRAIEEFRAGLKANPNYFILQGFLGAIQTTNRQYPEAISTLQGAMETSNRLPIFVAHLAVALEHSDRSDEAGRLWQELRDRSEREYVPPVCFVMMHGMRGGLPPLWKWLRRAGSSHDSYLPWFRILPAQFFRAPREPLIKTRLKTAILRRLIGRVMYRYRTVVGE